MHRIREILRQAWSLQRSQRQLAANVRCGVGTVWKVLQRANAVGLVLADFDVLDDQQLELRVLGKRVELRCSTRCPTSRSSIASIVDLP